MHRPGSAHNAPAVPPARRDHILIECSYSKEKCPLPAHWRKGKLKAHGTLTAKFGTVQVCRIGEASFSFVKSQIRIHYCIDLKLNRVVIGDLYGT